MSFVQKQKRCKNPLNKKSKCFQQKNRSELYISRQSANPTKEETRGQFIVWDDLDGTWKHMKMHGVKVTVNVGVLIFEDEGSYSH